MEQNNTPTPQNDKATFSPFTLTRRSLTGLLLLIYIVQFYSGCMQSAPKPDENQGVLMGWFFGNALAFILWGGLYLFLVKIVDVIERALKR